MHELTIFSTPNCELCEVAKNLIYTTLPAQSYRLTEQDVRQSIDLKKAYGFRIPVLQNTQTKEELFWPFNAEQILNLAR